MPVSPSPRATATAASTGGTTAAANAPELLREGLSMRRVLDAGPGKIRLAHNPRDGQLYLLTPAAGIQRLALDEPPALVQVATQAEIASDATSAGMAFGPDGTLFVVVNRRVDVTQNQALIRRGSPTPAGFRWQTLAQSEPYPLSGTNFDHLFNGVAVSPDGRFIFVNSGSRTDHGEVQDNAGAFPATREVALTARIFRLPADALDLTLPNDEAALAANDLVFARGTRNAYDLSFAPNGALFAVDNGPDADYPDELNWLQQGRHYGFPWRFGDQDNPQQFAEYDPDADRMLHADFAAVQSGTYRNDPAFPKAPGPLTDPVLNEGPAATQYRAADGSQREAADEGRALAGLTAHRSPLGLVFAHGDALPAHMRSTETTLSAFVLSWGSAGGTLSDRGQDLLHLRLIQEGDTYRATTTQVARNFKNPIDAALVEDRLYVLDYSQDGTIWELKFGR